MQRDTFIIATICVLAIGIGGWFFLSETNILRPVPFSVLAKGDHAQLEEGKNYRIKSEGEFVEFWVMAFGIDTPVPEVDFSTHHVLGVFDGAHSSGGYDISIVSVTDTKHIREVVVRHGVPGEGCMTTQALTSPFELILVPKSDASITRRDVTDVSSCN